MSTSNTYTGTLHQALYGSVPSLMFGPTDTPSDASVRDIVREEIRAALDEDAARRAVLVDYDRLTAEWRRKHGGKP